MTPSEEIVDVLECEEKTISLEEVQRAIDEIVAKLSQPKSIKLNYTVRKSGEGVGVIETIAIAFVGALAKEAAITTWKELIWPSLKLRFGNKIRGKSK